VSLEDLRWIVALDDFEALAEKALEPGAFAYYSGGSWDEVTLRDNVEAFRRRKFRPRVLVDVTDVDTSTTMLGCEVAMPVGIAPTALAGLADEAGEVAAAMAASDAGAVHCQSTMSSRSIEDIATAGGARWFQLYINRDRSLAEELVKRAEIAGCRALVLTVDLPVGGYREREMRVRFAIPLTYGNFEMRQAEGETFQEFIASFNDRSVTWDDLAWLKGLSSMPLVIKGILTAEDAALAAAHGADGIVVSNHGGRQMDRAPASIDVLEEVVDAVAGRAEVFIDGGVRRGIDVVTALALGAKGAFIGRPFLFALSVAGQEGVAFALALLRAELETAMRLLGVTRIDQIRRDHVR
jgi:isopentenyl diphosphate isomerase/L-lactate dehydrogenase-like FMN-dependent dehydrogenase